MVRALLDELARDVPNYADADRALGAARAVRRRRAGVAAAVLTVLAMVAAGAAWWPRPGPPDGVGPEHTESPTPVFPSQPALPEGAVGAAALVYRPRCAGPCFGVVVRLADGKEYSLRHGDFNVPSLSPDGRWLVAQFEFGSYQFRDLKGAGPLQRAQGEPLSPARWQPSAWSPDSRWLLMWGPHSDGGSEFARIDLVDRSVVTYRAPAGWTAAGVLPSGELLVAPSTWQAPLTLRRVDPVTGKEQPVPMDAAATVLKPDQLQRAEPTRPLGVSRNGAWIAIGMVAGGRVSGVVEIGTYTGAVHDHVFPSTGTSWEPVAYGTLAGIMVVSRGRPLAFGVFDLSLGRIVELTRVPDAEALLVPGGPTWYSP